MSTCFRSHAALIDQLGGGTTLAQALSAATGTQFGRQAIYMWKVNGVPWKWRPLIARLAAERGIPLPDEFLDPAPRREKGAT